MPQADIATLMPLFAALLLFAGAAIKSKSILLGTLSAYLVMGYIGVKSGNELFIGFYILTAFFMAMGTAVYLTQTVMGDTA